MASLKGQIDSLTNFIAPIYQSLLASAETSEEAKKKTVEILMSQVAKVATTGNAVDLYAMTPVLTMVELVLSSKIKSIPISKDTPKEVRDLVESFKGTLLSVHKFNEMCSKTKKE